MKKSKRIISFILAILLMVLCFDFSVFATELQEDNREEIIKNLKLGTVTEMLKNDDKDENIDRDKVVRIIVTLDENKMGTPSVSVKNSGQITVSTTKKMESKERAIESKQNNLLNDIEKTIEDFQVKNQFQTLMNGFSAEIKEKDIKKLLDMPQIKQVDIAEEINKNEVEPLMDSSTKMIKANQAWDLKYKGENSVAAVLDTGAFVEHRDFKLTNPEKARLKKYDIDNSGLPGRYYNEKVPYSYNYFDRTSEDISDKAKIGNQHGMHVAGTVVANGKIKGIAPEAQLLNMKVFSGQMNQETTFTDIYITAIEDAVKLGADSINLSLGSSGGFDIPDSPEGKVIKKAVDAGAIVTISSGNSRNRGYYAKESGLYGDYFVRTENPDVGVVGSPSSNQDAMTIGSFNNANVRKSYLTTDTKVQDIDGQNKFVYLLASKVNFSELNDKSGYPYINLDKGGKDDFERNKDNVRGKVALVKRGNPFADTIKLAEEYGAIACIVYNHEEGKENLVRMGYGNNAKIPFAFIGNKAGTAIASANHELVRLVFPEEVMISQSDTKDEISESSSWGPLPNLKLKPQITAPGNNIWSTQGKSEYANMSGTSMSSPHVAGAAILVKEFVKKNNIDYSEVGISNLIKNLMMNTADLKEDPHGNGYYPPRVIGAGMINLDRATRNFVEVVDSNTNKAQIELGDNLKESAEISLKIKNHGNTAENYNVKAVLIGEIIDGDKRTETFKNLNEQQLESITVNANSTLEFRNNINLTKQRDGDYAEGYIIFENKNDKDKNLVVPFLGFKGSYNIPKAIDVFDASNLINLSKVSKLKFHILDDNLVDTRKNEKSEFKFSGFFSTDSYGRNKLNDPSKTIIIGQKSGAWPIFTPLRNIKKIDYELYHKNFKDVLIKRLYEEKNIRKVSDIIRGIPAVAEHPQGGVYGATEQEGRYTYRMTATLDYKDYKQNIDFDILVDKTAPKILQDTIKITEREITFDVKDLFKKSLENDDVSRLDKIYVIDENKSSETFTQGEALKDSEIVTIEKGDGISSVKIDLEELVKNDIIKKDQDSISIIPVDKAGNIGEKVKINIANLVKTNASIYIQIPKIIDLHSVNQYSKEGIAEIESNDKMAEVAVIGYVFDLPENELHSITINGEKVSNSDIKYDYFVISDLVGTTKQAGNMYCFDTKIKVKEGYENDGFIIKAYGKSDPSKEIATASRHLSVDLSPPTLKVELEEIVDGIAKIKINARDNRENLVVNREMGNFETFVAKEESRFGGLKEQASIDTYDEVELKDLGNPNVITYIATDGVYETVESVVINKFDSVDKKALSDLITSENKEPMGEKLKSALQYGKYILDKKTSKHNEVAKAIRQIKNANKIEEKKIMSNASFSEIKKLSYSSRENFKASVPFGEKPPTLDELPKIFAKVPVAGDSELSLKIEGRKSIEFFLLPKGHLILNSFENPGKSAKEIFKSAIDNGLKEYDNGYYDSAANGYSDEPTEKSIEIPRTQLERDKVLNQGDYIIFRYDISDPEDELSEGKYFAIKIIAEGGYTNKDELSAAIRKAIGLNEAEYTEDSWRELEIALNNAKEINREENSTQEEIDEAKDKLLKAIDNLIEKTVQKINPLPKEFKPIQVGDEFATIRLKPQNVAEVFHIEKDNETVYREFKNPENNPKEVFKYLEGKGLKNKQSGIFNFYWNRKNVEEDIQLQFNYGMGFGVKKPVKYGDVLLFRYNFTTTDDFNKKFEAGEYYAVKFEEPTSQEKLKTKIDEAEELLKNIDKEEYKSEDVSKLEKAIEDAKAALKNQNVTNDELKNSMIELDSAMKLQLKDINIDFVFRVENGDENNLPEEVKSQKPQATTVLANSAKRGIMPPGIANTIITKGDKQWIFEGWTPKKVTNAKPGSSITFIGHWSYQVIKDGSEILDKVERVYEDSPNIGTYHYFIKLKNNELKAKDFIKSSYLDLEGNTKSTLFGSTNRNKVNDQNICLRPAGQGQYIDLYTTDRSGGYLYLSIGDSRYKIALESVLKLKIEEAKKIESKHYTEESYAELNNTLEEINSTSMDDNSKIKSLINAIENLELKFQSSSLNSSEADEFIFQIPSEKVVVKDGDSLSEEEKELVVEKIRLANKKILDNVVISISNNGDATIKFGDGSTKEILARDLIIVEKNNIPNNNLEDEKENAKREIDLLENLNSEQKEKYKEDISKAITEDKIIEIVKKAKIDNTKKLDKEENKISELRDKLIRNIQKARGIRIGNKNRYEWDRLQREIDNVERQSDTRDITELEKLIGNLEYAISRFENSRDEIIEIPVNPNPIEYPKYILNPSPSPLPKPIPVPEPTPQPVLPSTNIISDNRTRFVDIIGHWAEKAINYVVEKGYFSGKSEKIFAPNNPISRGEFITVLGRMARIESEVKNSKFDDVNSNMYYAKYINWAAEKGIVKGNGDNKFLPDQEMTREEMASILHRYFKYMQLDLKKDRKVIFKDKRKISTWAIEAVEELSERGIIKGMEDGKFSPKSTVTRAQVAQIVYSVENR